MNATPLKKLLMSILTVCGLAGTALLLVADSARECGKEAESAAFDVTGTCGDPGVLRLSRAADSCELDVQVGTRVGLPAEGELGHDGPSLQEGNFVLSGSVTIALPAESDADGGLEADGGTPDGGAEAIFRHCLAEADGGLVLSCTEGYPGDPTTVPSCRAILTPRE